MQLTTGIATVPEISNIVNNVYRDVASKVILLQTPGKTAFRYQIQHPMHNKNYIESGFILLTGVHEVNCLGLLQAHLYREPASAGGDKPSHRHL